MAVHVSGTQQEQSVHRGISPRVGFVLLESKSLKNQLNSRSLWAKAFGFSATSPNWPGISFKIPEQCVLKYNNRGVSVQQYNVPIKLFQLQPAFILLIIGYAAGLLQFFCELCYYYWKGMARI
jgi:hypothetical protein